MVKALQAQQQKVVINLAPPVKRKKKKRKKKSKAIDSVGDFRTALARSAFIQRGIGGLGFNQGHQFRPSLNANAVRLNARSNFEGVRTERPTLRTAMETQTDPNPVDTATGRVRGAIHTPRLLDENSLYPQTPRMFDKNQIVSKNISPIPLATPSISLQSHRSFQSSLFSDQDKDEDEQNLLFLDNLANNSIQESDSENESVNSPIANRLREQKPINYDGSEHRRNKKEMLEATDMGLEDTNRNEKASD